MLPLFHQISLRRHCLRGGYLYLCLGSAGPLLSGCPHSLLHIDRVEWYRIKEDRAEWYRIKEDRAEWYRIKEDREEWYRIKEDTAEWYRIKEDRAEWYRIKEDRAEWYRIKEDRAEWYRIKEDTEEWYRIKRIEYTREDENRREKLMVRKFTRLDWRRITRSRSKLCDMMR